jgi:hypothetical protein
MGELIMNRYSDKSQPAGRPELSELLARYLHGQAARHEAGLAVASTGEVLPHEAAPSPPVDPKLAWDESLAVLPFYASSMSGGAQSGAKLPKAPPDWPGLVNAQEPALAVAFCLGNFPQLIRSLQPLLHPSNLQPGTAANARSFDSSELVQWADRTANQKQFPDCLLAAGVLRLAKDFDRAGQLIPDEAEVPAKWRPACANERAALAWHRGQHKEALDSWQAQEETIPVLFNRGMACLFLNKAANARAFLQRAADRLPEDNAWHHLSRLYLAMSEMRS